MMNALRKEELGTEDSREFETLALCHVSTELEEFMDLSRALVKSFGFLQERVKSLFPKDCRKCGKVYRSFEEFYYGTDEINGGTVSYPTLGADFYLHRNCKSPCESTLVIVFKDRRDDGDIGSRRRAVFQRCLDKLQRELQIEPQLLREKLIGVLAKKLHEQQNFQAIS